MSYGWLLLFLRRVEYVVVHLNAHEPTILTDETQVHQNPFLDTELSSRCFQAELSLLLSGVSRAERVLGCCQTP
jgi:hypothetical protein